MSISIWNDWQDFCLSVVKKLYPSAKIQFNLPNNTRPDFIIPEKHLIIDAKLTTKSIGLKDSIRNYEEFCDTLEFWCLYGKALKVKNSSVRFIFPIEILMRLEMQNIPTIPYISELRKLRQKRFPPQKFKIASIFWDSDQPLKRLLRKGLESNWTAQTNSGEKRLPLNKEWFDQLWTASDAIKNPDIQKWVRTNLKRIEINLKSIRFDYFGVKNREILGIEIKSRFFATDMINRKKAIPYKKDFVKYHFSSPIEAWKALYTIEKANIGISGHEEFGQGLEFWKYIQACRKLITDGKFKKAHLAILVPFYADKKMLDWTIWSIKDLIKLEFLKEDLNIPIFVWQFHIKPPLQESTFIPEKIEFQEVWKNTDISISTPQTIQVRETLLEKGYGGVKGCNECKYLTKFCLKQKF